MSVSSKILYIILTVAYCLWTNVYETWSLIRRWTLYLPDKVARRVHKLAGLAAATLGIRHELLPLGFEHASLYVPH